MATPRTLAGSKLRLAPGQVPIRFRLLLGFAVPLTVWVLVSVLNIAVWNDAIDDSAALTDSEQLVLLANEYINASLRAQTAKRGFLMTSEEKFLDAYRQATKDVLRIHNELAGRIHDRPEQLRRLQAAGNLFQEWIYDITRPRIEARQQLHQDVVDRMHTLEKSLLMLQDLHMREPEGNGKRTALLAGIRTTTSGLLQRQDLAMYHDELRQALGELKVYADTVNADRGRAASALRDFIAILTRIIEAIAKLDAQIKQSIVDDGERTLLGDFDERMNAFIAAEQIRLGELRGGLAAADDRGRVILWAGPAIGLLLMVLMTSWMSRRIARSLEGISRAAKGLARGDLSARALVDGNDEFAVLADRFNAMAGLVESRSRESAALAELGELLQSSTSINEAARIFGDLAHKLFPGQPGALYLMAPSRDEVVAVTSWSHGEQLSQAEFVPEECWALRLSRPHENISDNTVRCTHLTEERGESLCLPLHAFGETLGMLFVARPDDGFADGSVGADQHREFTDTVAEQLALALANLRMRETLRHQSIRDPLTQLYNRRYLDETFRRELHRAARRSKPLSVLTFDIDHFKRFNDTYGHDGGDELLKAVGNSLRDFFRAEDGAFRAGGEEFVAVLPETSLADAVARAEELREEIAHLEVQHGNVLLPAVTISVGVAAYPQHGQSIDQLLKAADRALYRAKENGRNRVLAAE